MQHSAIIQLLCIDQHTGQYSHTKFWSNIGYGIMCYTFLYEVMTDAANTELWMVFGAIVIGNQTLTKYLTRKKESTDVGS